MTSSGLTILGPYLSWAQLAAGLLDVVENGALIRLLRGSRNPSWPPLVRWCAIPKFVIVGLGVVYVLLGGVSWVTQKRSVTP